MIVQLALITIAPTLLYTESTTSTTNTIPSTENPSLPPPIFNESDCKFESHDNFVRKICRHPGDSKSYFKCLFSDTIYTAKSIGLHSFLYSVICPHDKFNYQACYQNPNSPLIAPANTSLVCGTVICNHIHMTFYDIWCDGKNHCESGIDEMDCQRKDEKCYHLNDLIEDSSQVIQINHLEEHFLKSNASNCDGRCDCYGSCYDEWLCDGYEHFYRCPNSTLALRTFSLCMNDTGWCPGGEDARRSELCRSYTGRVCKAGKTITVLLTNYTRCLPHVICTDKLDQTNCSNPSKAFLSCTVDGYPSTVSNYILCNKNIRYEVKLNEVSNKAICDDGIDEECIYASSSCFIHKHQLCDGIQDCSDGYDEMGPYCKLLTKRGCVLRYSVIEAPRLFPQMWLLDGVQDCANGEDEEEGAWIPCRYEHFTTYGAGTCEDVFICRYGLPRHVTTGTLCDRGFACEGGETFCLSSYATRKDFIYPPVGYSGHQNLMFCLPGLEDIKTKISGCTSLQFPAVKVYGTTPINLLAPNDTVDCRYTFGETYYYLTVLNRCKLPSAIESQGITSTSCSNQHSKTYSITFEGKLVFVHNPPNSEEFKVDETFVCQNHNCIPYGRVCDLVDDCGDGSDENNCTNNFICRETKEWDYIPISAVCDGVYDCSDLSDELSCCDKQVVKGLHLMIAIWIIGVSSVLLNVAILIKRSSALVTVKSKAVLFDKVYIILICLGDGLIGVYLISIGTVNVYYRDVKSFCDVYQFEWLTSFQCACLGVISTVGSQISLFSMALAIPHPVSHKVRAQAVAMAVVIITLSLIIAVIPLLDVLEDNFVNALFYPSIAFLKGFVRKVDSYKTFKEYYGSRHFKSSDLSWSVIRRLIQGMFTRSYSDIKPKVLHFYGNDPVCLFKYFVSWNEPQVKYSWFVLGINFICFIIISVSYTSVNIVSLRSGSQVSAGNVSNHIRKRNQKLQRKISVIIATDFLCWVPFIVTSFLHTMEVIDASPWYALFSIVILPINSVINPLLYDPIVPNLMSSGVKKLVTLTSPSTYRRSSNAPGTSGGVGASTKFGQRKSSVRTQHTQPVRTQRKASVQIRLKPSDQAQRKPSVQTQRRFSVRIT